MMSKTGKPSSIGQFCGYIEEDKDYTFTLPGGGVRFLFDCIQKLQRAMVRIERWQQAEAMAVIAMIIAEQCDLVLVTHEIKEDEDIEKAWTKAEAMSAMAPKDRGEVN